MKLLIVSLLLIHLINAQQPCLLNPCKNGNCVPNVQLTSFICQCFTGYTGKLCDTRIPPIHPCAINPCYNGGSCSTNDGVTFVCKCPPNYSGIRCDRPTNNVVLSTDACRTSSPCLNGGTCVNIPFPNANPPYACICPSTLTGPTCNIYLNNQQVINRCLNNPCLNGGTCEQTIQNNLGYTCRCLSQYYGANCQYINNNLLINDQQQNACGVLKPCLNGGTCVNVPFANVNPKYACICPPSYTGQNCQTLFSTNTLLTTFNDGRPACNQPYCLNGGTCYLNTTSITPYPMCLCNRGYVGLKCEVDVCKLNVVRGPCLASLERYAYNSVQKQCVPFVYGGCQANLNNFETLDECQRVCRGR